jgi:hypothetical protein
MSPFSEPSAALWLRVLLDTFLRMNNDPRNVHDPLAQQVGPAVLPGVRRLEIATAPGTSARPVQANPPRERS